MNSIDSYEDGEEVTLDLDYEDFGFREDSDAYKIYQANSHGEKRRLVLIPGGTSIVDDEGDVVLLVGKHKQRVLVSAALLAKHSKPFRSMLRGPWKEATQAASAENGPTQTIELPCDDLEPMLLLFKIIHHKAEIPYNGSLAFDKYPGHIFYAQEEDYSGMYSGKYAETHYNMKELLFIGVEGARCKVLLSLLTVCDKYFATEVCKSFIDMCVTNCIQYTEELCEDLWKPSTHASQIPVQKKIDVDGMMAGRRTPKSHYWTELDSKGIARVILSMLLCCLHTNNHKLFWRVGKCLILFQYPIQEACAELRKDHPNLENKLNAIICQFKHRMLLESNRVTDLLDEFQAYLDHGSLPEGPFLELHGVYPHDQPDTYILGKHDLKFSDRFRSVLRGLNRDSRYAVQVPLGGLINQLETKVDLDSLAWDTTSDPRCAVCQGGWKEHWKTLCRKLRDEARGLCSTCTRLRLNHCDLHGGYYH
ncbi:hypothetical protein BT63DRAFT_453539 [Microthyrium microscopicum]|uniref:BTB domain-containing protein n=1 Tax=Microthyrium microscopicum TaxID=703497 RepID=A0A6A6UI83_9PEZI|nr:hypothetical protein BT63DRAFT_453539 [Microthyrium microscopicum]